MGAIDTGKFKGWKLRELRKARNWSQSKLAKKIGAHVTSISDWERGDNDPSGRHVAGLAREFGVQAAHFYGGDDDAEAATMAPLAADHHEVLEALYDAIGAALNRADRRKAIRALEREQEKV